MKDKLKNIFQNSYPGIDIFISDVLIPIFSEDFIEKKNVNLIVSEEIKKRADNANILSAYHVADVNRIDSDPVAVYDVTLKQNCRIAHSRVAIRQFIAALSMTYTHVFIVFHYENANDQPWRFSYVYKEGTTVGTRNTAKRYTYVFGKDYRCRTAVDRFDALADSPKTDANFADAFSVEALDKEFIEKYTEQYLNFVKYIQEQEFYTTSFNEDGKAVRDYVKKLLGRIVFMYFLQRKGWLDGNKNYMHDLFHNSTCKDDFLDKVLEPLFFGVLNTHPKDRTTEALALPGGAKIPYLNGGLFQNDELDDKECKLPSEYFENLFALFNQYNFTIDENDPEDAEVGVDPEMLGHIFESLLEDNKDKGAYYTPKEIVQYMCQESLISYLETNTNIAKDKIRQFVLNPYEYVVEGLTEKQQSSLQKALENVKICDPAIGSGAFPMGLLNELLKCRVALCGADCNRTEIKKSIIQNNIYGVDIEKGAVDIARLRFWLSIVVDEEGTPSPLPNLNYKIMQGNSLIESFMGIDLSDLTYKKESKNDTGIPTLYDDSKVIMQKDVSILLREYYSCSDHDSKIKLQQRISNSISSLLEKQNYDIEVLNQLREINLAGNDKFFLWHTWFSDVFEKGGFDIVIGNPPYIKEGRMSKTFFEPYKDSPYYKGKMDIWYLFACNGLDLLNPNGVLCFIATNNWVTSFGASKLRDKVIKETRICNIVDFGAVMMFDSASIQTMIMMFQKDKITDDYTFDYRKLTAHKATEKEAIAILNKTSDDAEYYTPTIKRKNLLGKNITFSQNTSILTKILSYSNNVYLTNKEIAQGIVFPQDTLNKKNQLKLGEQFYPNQGIFVLTKLELDALNLSENELSLIKPYYTTENIKRYGINEANRYWTIYTDSSYKSSRSLDNYPKIKSHLDNFLSIFTSDNKPYGLHRAREERFFINEKVIAVRKCVERPVFSYCDFECYLSQTFNMIQTDRVNMKYLTGLLNSKLIEFWLKNKGKMQGANYQLDKEPLLSIPIGINYKFESRLISLVDKLINLGCEDFNIEKEIDNIVYHIYELTYDEILIVDPETPITKEEYDCYVINIED